MMKFIFVPLFVFSVCFSSQMSADDTQPRTKSAVATADFYVATHGNDAWSGRLPSPNAGMTDGPFASLERARNAIRAKKSAAGGMSVVIRGGVYARSATLTLGKDDSGAPGAPIVYRGFPEQRLLSRLVSLYIHMNIMSTFFIDLNI